MEYETDQECRLPEVPDKGVHLIESCSDAQVPTGYIEFFGAKIWIL